MQQMYSSLSGSVAPVFSQYHYSNMVGCPTSQCKGSNIEVQGSESSVQCSAMKGIAAQLSALQCSVVLFSATQ